MFLDISDIYKQSSAIGEDSIEVIKRISFFLKINKYGCYRIERYKDTPFYSIGGYKNSDEVWNFEQFDNIELMVSENAIQIIKQIAPYISENEQICTICFQNKKLIKESNQLVQTEIWCKTPNSLIRRIQKEIICSGIEKWAGIKDLNACNKNIYFSLCHKHKNDSECLYHEKINQIKRIVYKNISSYLMNGAPEKLLESFIIDHIYLIEEGMEFITNQLIIKGGVIDIYALDKNRVPCIIELKTIDNDKNILYQAAYYQANVTGAKHRMITLTPGYTNEIYKSLKLISNVEMFYYHLDKNGIITIDRFEIEQSTITCKTN